MTSPLRLNSGPPELPGLICVSVWMYVIPSKFRCVVEMTPHRRVVRLSYLVSRVEPYCSPLYQALDWVVRQTRQGDRLIAVDLGDIFMTFARKIG